MVAAPSLPALPAIVRRRIDGTHPIDEWGLDPDVIEACSPLVGLRWSVETQWVERVPDDGGAVLVHNRVLGLSEAVVLARGIRRATGRHVRTAGLPDVPPVATLGRAFGAVVDRPRDRPGPRG